MFARLVEVREGMGAVAAGFDPALLTAGECAEAVEAAAAIEKMAAHVKGLAAARVADTGLWRGSGARSAEEDLARRAGVSVTRAKEQLQTARRARSQPAVDAAARAGRLSPEQAAVIADAAVADPGAEEGLVEQAGRGSLRELAERCGQVKAAATDPEERHRRVHAERRVRTFTDSDGGWNLHLRHTPEVGAAILEQLRPVQDRLFRQARTAGRREPSEAYAADALVEVLLRDTTGSDGDGEGASAVRVASKAAKIVVRVDWDALVRGFPTGGEVCEIPGVGPVPVSVVEAMLATGDVFLTAVVTRGVDVVNVAHLGRQPTAFQVTGLQWSDPTCQAEGCSQAFRFEIDHRADWSRTKITLLSLLDRLCHHHHDLKTRLGWALVHGEGKRPIVAPDDPRHPGPTTTRTVTGSDPPARTGHAA